MYICVIGVVISNGNILLIRKIDHDDGEVKYIMPGGHWDVFESFVAGARRETYEETGVKTAGGKLILVKYNKNTRNRLELYYLLDYIPQKSELVAHDADGNDPGLFEPMFVNLHDAQRLRVKNENMRAIINRFQDTNL